MSRDLSLQLDLLTRVEGHGHIVIDVAAGELKTCQLQIVEPPRFFEALLVGRSIFEAQHISSRICGICACGHSLASLQAAEEALGFTPSSQTVQLRKLLLYLEHIDSHLLHIYMLVLPDLLGVKSFLGLLAAHGELVRRVLRMKKACNEACDILVGRHVHPISCVIGGFTKLPEPRELARIHHLLCQVREDLVPGVELLAGLAFPSFERATEYVALVSDDGEYPLYGGELGSSDGVRKPKGAYRDMTNEFLLPHSSAKHARLSRSSYMVGALARFNLNRDKLNPGALAVAQALGLSAPCTNPYLNSAAQLVETVHSAAEALLLVEALTTRGVDLREAVPGGINEKQTIPLGAGSGVGAVEVPRGLLFHHYEIDAAGIIRAANCVIPTGQNLQNLEDDMRKLVPEILTRSTAEVTLALEMLVRAYDPCISCATHQLRIEWLNR